MSAQLPCQSVPCQACLCLLVIGHFVFRVLLQLQRVARYEEVEASDSGVAVVQAPPAAANVHDDRDMQSQQW